MRRERAGGRGGREGGKGVGDGPVWCGGARGGGGGGGGAGEGWSLTAPGSIRGRGSEAGPWMREETEKGNSSGAQSARGGAWLDDELESPISAIIDDGALTRTRDCNSVNRIIDQVPGHLKFTNS